MKFIIPMIVGSVIGYATNWLAIKMLFRPYYEKRFMGIKVPFTPGLIPKEKARISKNIGETVGEYLLSPETIAETLSSEKTNRNIKLWIQEKIKGLRDSEKSVKDLLLDIFGEGYNNIIESMERTISGYLVHEIRSEKFKDIIIDFIKSKIYDDRIYEDIKTYLVESLDKSLKSEEVEFLVQGKLKEGINNLSKDERILKDFLPEGINLEIDKFLDGNIEAIGNGVRDIVNSQDIQYKLKDSISDMVDQNISRLITSFISTESISEKIYSAISKYINDEDSNKDILLMIKSIIEKIMENKISELTPGILDKINPMDLSKYIVNYISHEDNQEGIIHILDKKMKNIDRDKIIADLSRELDLMLNSEMLNKEISLIINNSINKLTDRPVSDILNKFEENSSKIYSFVKVIFDGFIKDELPGIIRLFNVSKIVEDEINKFDVKFTEKLILDIAHKELRAITWLGALLGAIMGLLSPLLQMI